MAIYKVTNKDKIANLFKTYNVGFVDSYFQGYMGLAYCDDLENPKSSQIFLGDFCFLGGEVNFDLLRNRPKNYKSPFLILVAMDEDWYKAVQLNYRKNAIKLTRYKLSENPKQFDKTYLNKIISNLSPSFEIRRIDSYLYDEILKTNWAKDLCSNYETFKTYNKNGLGFVILQAGEIVAGASSYLSYHKGIEIQVNTKPDMFRRGLALAVSSQLILQCLENDIFPHWDAHNLESLGLAKKLGYRLEKEYISYGIFEL